MSTLYHKNGTIAWTGTRGYHDNSQIAWSKNHAYYYEGSIAYQGKYAYHKNGVLAWNGTMAYHEDGSYAGSEGIKLETGNDIYLYIGKKGFELNILDTCVVRNSLPDIII